MTEQFDGNNAATSTVDADWFAAHRTTPEEQEAIKWRDERNAEVEGNRKIKHALNWEYDAYREQIKELDKDARRDLADKSPKEMAVHLDELNAAENARKQVEGEFAKLDAEQAEANLAAGETERLSSMRRSYTKAANDAVSLDERIAELQRLNELRDDPAAKGWDDLPAEQWRDAREGKLGDRSQEISSLVLQKQAALQEAALYQSGYHEGVRAIQPAAPQPIGNFNGMQLTQADIQGLVQLERDEQAHNQRAAEARSRYADWDQAFRDSGNPLMRNEHLAFIKSLPNSADVAYYLATHPSEATALVQMPNYDATRVLIDISHRARPQESTRRTSAPKPPSPVDGATRGSADINDDSTSADEWFRLRNADLKRRGRL
jgi:hypothetical protein